jgi:hypothetical protein
MLLHTTGDVSGSTVSSSAWTPRAFKAARLGSWPAASIGSITRHEPPSMPTRMTRAAAAGTAPIRVSSTLTAPIVRARALRGWPA